jgi:hypothetical protein
MPALITLFSILLLLLGLFAARKNVFMAIFFVLCVVFIYGRYFITTFWGGYTLGRPEWIFPGVEESTVVLYQGYFLVFLAVLVSISFFSRPVSVQVNYDFVPPPYLFLVITVVALAGAYRGFLYTELLIKEGYLATVNFSPPRALSLVTGTFLKPMALFFALLYSMTSRKLWKFLFIIYAGLIVLSWQRIDIVVILIIYLALNFSSIREKMHGKYIGYTARLLGVFVMAFLIFFIREGFESSLGEDLILDLFWATGISVNPGLYVIENVSQFKPSDVLGFPLTYFFCGIGKLFVQTCSSDNRLELMGFFLEKITSAIGIDANGSFIGLGGNIVASIFVASRLTDVLYFDFIFFVFFSVLFCIYVNYCFNNGFRSVIGLLFIGALLIAARSSLDGAIPALNQIIAAVLLDMVLKRNLFMKQKKIC